MVDEAQWAGPRIRPQTMPGGLWYDPVALDPGWPPPRPRSIRRRRLVWLTSVLLVIAMVGVVALTTDALGRDRQRIRFVTAGTEVTSGPYRFVPQRAQWSANSQNELSLRVLATCELVDEPMTPAALALVGRRLQASWVPVDGHPPLNGATVQLDRLGSVRGAPRSDLAPGVGPVDCTLVFEANGPIDPPPDTVVVNFQELTYAAGTGVNSDQTWQSTGSGTAVQVPAVVIPRPS